MHKVAQSSTNQEEKLSKIGQNKNISKKDKPRKVIVRNCEVKNFQNIVEYRRENGDSLEDTGSLENDEENKFIKDDEKSIFAEPKLFTSLKIVESIQNITAKGNKTIKIQALPHDLKSGKNKVNKKVNIPFEEKVYKDLIDLHINDEDLGISGHQLLKPREFNKVKEPEPVLSDFYKPFFDKEYVVKPNLTKFETEKICFEQSSTILKTSRQWEPADLNYF